MIKGEKTFYEACYKMAGLNHTEEVGEENLGWTQGVLSNGLPFQAELWIMDNELTMCVIIPEIINRKECKETEYELCEDEIQEGIRRESSILKIGTYDRGYVTDYETIIRYVEYLEEYKIITFLSEHRNGGVHLLRDIEGNNLAAVMVTLCTIKESYAETPLVFKEYGSESQRVSMYLKMHM